MTMNLEQAAKDALDALDGFMGGSKLTPEQIALQERAVKAGAFAAAAYGACQPKGGAEYHALTRAFLVALIDPLHADLDYLRGNPEAGQTARDARARQSN